MKKPIFILLIATGVWFTAGQLAGQNLRADYQELQVTEAPLKEVLQKLEKIWKVRFNFSPSRINPDQRITLRLQPSTLVQTLDSLGKKGEFSWKMKEAKIWLIPAPPTVVRSVEKLGKVLGKITDQETHEPVADAMVWLVNDRQCLHTLSDENGTWKFDSVTTGQYQLQIRHLSNEPWGEMIRVESGETLEIQSGLKSREEIIVVNIRESKTSESIPTGKVVFDQENCSRIQGIEYDPLGAARLLPGVNAIGGVFSSSEFSVHGGLPDENQYLVDNVPVYMPFYATGRSIFNGDAFEGIEFHTAGFPARYGGALSSITNFQTRKGDMEKFRGSAGLNFNSLNLQLEGPVVSEKISFMVAARGNPLHRAVFYDENYIFPSFNDWNINITAKADPQNLFSFTGLIANSGLKKARLNPRPGDPITAFLNGNNAIFTFQWLHVPNEKLSNRANLYLQGFDQRQIIPGLYDRYQQKKMVGLRDDLCFMPWQNGWFRAGISLDGIVDLNEGYFLADPYDRDLGNPDKDSIQLDTFSAGLRSTLYLLYEGKINSWLSGNLGFIVEGDQVTDQTTLSPRLLLQARVGSGNTLRASLGQYRQNAPLLVSYPGLQPGMAEFYGLGFCRVMKFPLTFDALAWYKKYELLPIRDAAYHFDNQGKGRAWGLDLRLARETGLLRGSVACTWSQAWRRDHLQTQENPFRFDVRQNLNLAVSLVPVNQHRWWVPAQTTLVFHYSTGMPFTPVLGQDILQNQLIWGEPNSQRFTPNHYLNLRLCWEVKTGKHGLDRVEWFVDVWNLYNQRSGQAWAYQYNPQTEFRGSLIRQTGILVWPGLKWKFNPH